MKKKSTKKQEINEIWALHIDGNLITPKIRRTLIREALKGSFDSYWRMPKPFYVTKGTASSGQLKLPKQIRSRVKIVKYIPESEKLLSNRFEDLDL